MSYDPNVPDNLKKMQTWFADVITQPIDQKSRISPLAPSGQPIEEEALRYLKPSPTLKPEQRIQIYNQQYWWRLLNIMQSTYTMATHMLGFKKFNEQIAVPYLETFPSNHYSVSHIGSRLLEWMEMYYSGSDKQLLTDAVAIDDAMNNAFFAASYPTISEGKTPEETLTVPGVLQAHLTLFKLDYHLFKFRDEIHSKDPDYWSSHHYPNLEHALSEENGHFPKLTRGTHCFVVYRSRLNHTKWEEISEEEHALLSLFHHPTTIEQACEWLSDGGRQYVSEAAPHLREWIQGWVAKQWLRQPD